MKQQDIRKMNKKWTEWRLNEGVGGDTVFKALNAVTLFYNHYTAETFNEIFGEQFGPSMWSKFTKKYKQNIALFWQYLDGGNRKLLSDYIGKKY